MAANKVMSVNKGWSFSLWPLSTFSFWPLIISIKICKLQFSATVVALAKKFMGQSCNHADDFWKEASVFDHCGGVSLVALVSVFATVVALANSSITSY